MEKFEFNDQTHTYKLNDKILPSVTQIINGVLFYNKYSSVSEDTLELAKNKGSLIHKEIENYIKKGETGFTLELGNFINIVNDKKIEHMKSEVKVHNKEIAGTIDIVCKIGDKNIIIDTKTTAELDKEYVSWQLSMYAYILETYYSVRIDELYAMWLRDEKYKFVKVEKKTHNQIEDVLEAFKNGSKIDLYSATLQTIPLDNQIAFMGLVHQMNDIENKIKEVKEAILKEMEDRGLSKVEIGNVTITYKQPTTRVSIDTKKLKEDGLYDKYSKISNVKGSISIKLEEDNNEQIE